MAGVAVKAVTPETSFSTSTKTMLQIAAPSNQRLMVTEWSISFIGTSNTAQPIRVDVLRQTTGGTASSLTPVKGNNSDSETLQSTAEYNATAEPTAGDVLFSEEIHPQTGYTWQAPFGQEIPVPGGGRLGIRVTAAAGTSCVCRMNYYE